MLCPSIIPTLARIISGSLLPSSPGLAVLADATLWCRISASVGGWPFPLVRFYHDVVTRYVLREPSEGDSPDQFPQRHGAVLHVALAESDLLMLKMAYKTRKSLATNDPGLALLDTSRAAACAAYYGRVDALCWITDTAATEPEWWAVNEEENLMLAPLYRGDVAMLELLARRFPSESTRIRYVDLKHAVLRNDTATVQWAYDRGYAFIGYNSYRTKFLMDHAASLEMLEVMHSGQRDVGYTTRAMDKAAALGDLRMVRYLHKQRAAGCTHAALDLAAKRGSLDVVRYLHEHGLVPWGSLYAMDAAAVNGHLDVVGYLHEHRSEGCSTAAMDGAAMRGHLAIVRFLHEHASAGCTTDAIDSAAEHGHHEVVRFLHAHRTEGCTTKAMDAAAPNGHLDVVRFLHEHRCEGYSLAHALNGAAAGGYVEVLKFLLANRPLECSGDRAVAEALDKALAHGHETAAMLLREQLQEKKP